jgi:hypothetical protein
MASGGQELNWFKFETKLHDYITLRFAPVLKMLKQLDEKNEYQELKLKKLKESLTDSNNKIQKLDRKSREIDDIKDDLFNLRQTVRSHEVLQYENNGKFNTYLKNMREKLKLFEDDFKSNEFSIDQYKADIISMHQKLIEHKVYYNGAMTNLRTEYSEKMTDFNRKMQKTQLKEIYDEGIMANQKNDIDRMIIDIEIMKNKQDSNSTDLIDLNNFKRIFAKGLDVNKTEILKIMLNPTAQGPSNISSHDIQLFSNRLNMLEVDLRKTDNYIEKQLPLKYITAFGELVDFTFSTKNVRDKLKEFMEYKITELNEAIEKDKGWPTIDKTLSTVNELKFRYTQLTVPELLKELRLKSSKSIRSSKTIKISEFKQVEKFVSKISLEHYKEPQTMKGPTSANSRDRQSQNEKHLHATQPMTSFANKFAKSDLQPGDIGDQYEYIHKIVFI